MPDEKPKLADLIAAQASRAPKPRGKRPRKSATKRLERSSAPPRVSLARAVDANTPDRADKRPAEMVRELMIRRFVTAYVREHFHAGKALRSIRPELSARSARELAYQLLQAEDVRNELFRQLKGVAEHADLDEAWVKAHYKAIAEVSALDFVEVDASGSIKKFTLDPTRLTPLQRRCIRGLRISAAGKVIGLDLPPLKEVVDSVARLNKLFGEVQDEAAGREFAQRISELMQRAAKLYPPPQTFLPPPRQTFSSHGDDEGD